MAMKFLLHNYKKSFLWLCHQVTFFVESLTNKGVSESEVFQQHLTLHLTEHLTFSILAYQAFLNGMALKKSEVLSDLLGEVSVKQVTL